MTFPSDVAPPHGSALIDPIDDPDWKHIPQAPPADPSAPASSISVFAGVGSVIPFATSRSVFANAPSSIGGETFMGDSASMAGHAPSSVIVDFIPASDPQAYDPSMLTSLSLRDRPTVGPPTKYIPPFSLARHADLDPTRIPTNFIPTKNFAAAPSLAGSSFSFRSKGTKAAKLTARAGTIWSMGGAFSEEIEPPKDFYVKPEKKYRGGHGSGSSVGGSVYGGGGGSRYGGGAPSLTTLKGLPRFVSPEDPSLMTRAEIMGWAYGKEEPGIADMMIVSVEDEHKRLGDGVGLARVNVISTPPATPKVPNKRSFPEPGSHHRIASSPLSPPADADPTFKNLNNKYQSPPKLQQQRTFGTTAPYDFISVPLGGGLHPGQFPHNPNKLYHVADITSKLGGDALKAGTIHLIGYGMEIRARGKWGQALTRVSGRMGVEGIGLGILDEEEEGGTGAKEQDGKNKDEPQAGSVQNLGSITNSSSLLLPSPKLEPKLSLIDAGDTQISKVDSPPDEDANDSSDRSNSKVKSASSAPVDPFAFLYTAAKQGKVVQKESLKQAEITELPPSPTISAKVEMQEFDLVDGDAASIGSGPSVRDEDFGSEQGEDGEQGKEGPDEVEGSGTQDIVLATTTNESERGAGTNNPTGRILLNDILNAPLADQTASAALMAASKRHADSQADGPTSTIPQTFPHYLHPDHSLISWIHVIPDAHPNFTPQGDYELWIHTSSEVVYLDPRNVGRPIPMFGLEQGFVTPAMRATGMESMGNTGRSSPGSRGPGGVMVSRDGKWGTQMIRRNGAGGVAGEMKIGYMGWWVIKGFRQVEPESQELLEMLSQKEENNNYGELGRTIEAWHKGLSQQRWVKVNMEKYVPAVGAKKLLNPMESRWELAIEEVARPVVDKSKTSKDPKAEDSSATLPTDYGNVGGKADSDSSGSPPEEAIGTTTLELEVRATRPAKRFERIIGWENYVREVIEDAKGEGAETLLA